MKILPLLFKFRNKQSAFRVIATLLSVCLATLLLLSVVSLGQGWLIRNEKSTLLDTALTAATLNADEKVESVSIARHNSIIDSKSIDEIGLYVDSAAANLPEGFSNTPEKNELWVTPALKKLIDTKPDLQQRFKDYTMYERVSPNLAASPDSLVLLYKLNSQTLRADASESHVRRISPDRLQAIYSKDATSGNITTQKTFLLMVGVVLITPLLLLVTEISKIGILQRDKRYASLSLIGATPKQIRLLVTLETLPLALTGSVLGALIFALFGTAILSRIPIGDGTTIWPESLSLEPLIYAIVTIMLVFCFFFAIMQTMRSIKISPLLVARTNNDLKKPSIFTVLPLVLGFVGMHVLFMQGYAWYNRNTELGALLLITLLALIIVGIYLSGPLIMRFLSFLLLATSRRAATILAAYRLRHATRKVFRSTSGVIISLFVGAVFMTFLATTISLINADEPHRQTIAQLDPLQQPHQITINLPQHASATDAKKLLGVFSQNTSTLLSDSYIQKGFNTPQQSEDDQTQPINGNYYESCSQLESRTLVSCSDNQISGPLVVSLQIADSPPARKFEFVPSINPVTATNDTVYDKDIVLVAKDDKSYNKAINIASSLIDNYRIKDGLILSIQYTPEDNDSPTRAIQGVSALVIALVIFVIIIGGLSIFVGIAGSIIERRRFFSQLLIIGADQKMFTKLLLIETLAPLVFLSIIVVALGILFSYYTMSISGFFNHNEGSFSLPGIQFWLGMVVAITICALTALLNISLVKKLANPNNLRSE